ncbi:coiled-coil domain-containing protein [Ruegeria aquimaris]|uniref:Chromosome partition protein Smc n=1 Tax=Ruegeria aquimaris TaxID=2984333 RepID=A0ABT3AF53_9RHOB|nr:hypothetical protein [Ruegeria sp. XHP0148]MCV2886927.1 hypothetical protein [Ruegeria sp. XHP0148]
MSQIEELQGRISAAMERISAGVESLGKPQPVVAATEDAEPDADLLAQLEDERLANAQLEERLRSIKAKHAAEIEALTSQDDGSADAGELDRLRSELDEVRRALSEAQSKLEAAASEQEAEDRAAMQAEIEALRAQVESAEDIAPLKAELEQLRSQTVNPELVDQLREENAALKAELSNSERLSDLLAELEMLRAERVSHGEAMSRLDGDLQRLRKANDQLRKVVSELRTANEAGVGEPHLINSAMLAELEALRAQRATDASEVHAVLSKLGPLLSAANLAEGEDE